MTRLADALQRANQRIDFRRRRRSWRHPSPPRRLPWRMRRLRPHRLRLRWFRPRLHARESGAGAWTIGSGSEVQRPAARACRTRRRLASVPGCAAPARCGAGAGQRLGAHRGAVERHPDDLANRPGPWARKLVGTEGFSGAARAYRKLAATLHHAQAERGIKVVMIASALPGEGKSLTAVNLALTLSESYQRRVLLIDADLRRPTVAAHLRHAADRRAERRARRPSEDRPMTVTQVSERLFVLPAGRPDADPMSGADVRPDAASASRRPRAVRLGDHRHAAGRPAARREPARRRWSTACCWWCAPGKAPVRARQARGRGDYARAHPRRRHERGRHRARPQRGRLLRVLRRRQHGDAEQVANHGQRTDSDGALATRRR